MSSGSLQPCNPTPDLRPAVEGPFWDYDESIIDSEACRHARQLAAAAAHERGRPPRFARGGARTLLLVGTMIAGVVSGMLVGGKGRLTLDPWAWRPLITQVWSADETHSTAAAPAGQSRFAGATITSSARADTVADAPPVVAAGPTPAIVARDADFEVLASIVAALPAEVSVPFVRATDWFDTELVDGVILAATMSEIPAGAIVRSELAEPMPTPPAVPVGAIARGEVPELKPTPPATQRPASAYRVQLATLRYRRNAEPVWQGFVSRLGPLAAGLERYVLPVSTKYGRRHLVQAGPFADAAHAQAMCQRVVKRGGDCLVVPPS